MSALRWVRIVGFILVALGFGSIYMRMQLDMDTVLTTWMGGFQPWSGIIMGVVGIVLVVVGFVLARQRKEVRR